MEVTCKHVEVELNISLRKSVRAASPGEYV